MDEALYDELWLIFKSLGKNAIAMDHYDLAEETEHDPETWKTFLLEQEVSDWIKTELKLIQETELKKMIKDVSSSRSVGQAQLMNSLSKIGDDSTIKNGPVFIYTYVPLNNQQKQAPNTKEIAEDVFEKRRRTE